MLRLALNHLCFAMNELADAAIGIVYTGAEQHLQKRRAEDQPDELVQHCHHDKDQQHADRRILQQLQQVPNVNFAFHHGPIIPQRPKTAEL